MAAHLVKPGETKRPILIAKRTKDIKPPSPSAPKKWNLSELPSDNNEELSRTNRLRMKPDGDGRKSALPVGFQFDLDQQQPKFEMGAHTLKK